MKEHFHESNLIAGYDDPDFDRALEWAWDFLASKEKLSEEIICITHYISTYFQKDLSPIERGRYRRESVTVGGRLCPDHSLINHLMRYWINDTNNSTLYNVMPTPDYPIGSMHIRFEKIHPFIDGNGRLGRLLMWWHEKKMGIKPTLILNSEKQDYYKWFE